MKIVFKMVFLLFLLSACASIPSVTPTTTQLSRFEATLESATPLPTQTPSPSFSPTPTLSPFPTLSDDYYSTPSMFDLVYIKMFDEFNGWGWATNYDGNLYRPVRTSDGGKSWIDATPFERLSEAHYFFLDSETAWVSAKNLSETNEGWFIYFTQNGGRSWETFSVALEAFTSFHFIRSLHFTDSVSGWAEGSGLCRFNCPVTLYQTIDSGRTWNIFPVNPPNGQTPLNILDGNFEIAFGSEFLFRSTANIWISNHYGGSPSDFKYFYVTWDGGNTWEVTTMPFKHEIFSDTDLFNVDLPVFFGDHLGYVTTQYLRNAAGEKVERLLVIFVTNDGGHTWTQKSSITQKLYEPDYVDFVSPYIAFTACDAGLCITRDGAQTWQVVQLNQAQGNFFDKVESFDIDFVTDLKGWLLTGKTRVGGSLRLPR